MLNSTYLRKWRAEHPGKQAAYSKKWRAEHPGKQAAYSKKWRAEHPGKQAAYSKKWRTANPKKQSAATLAWAKQHPKRTRAALYGWRRKNKKAIRRIGLNYTQGKGAYEHFEKQLKKQHRKCAICLRRMKEPCFDHNHKTKTWRGALCHTCNQAIGLLREDLRSLRRAILYLKKWSVL